MEITEGWKEQRARHEAWGTRRTKVISILPSTAASSDIASAPATSGSANDLPHAANLQEFKAAIDDLKETWEGQTEKQAQLAKTIIAKLEQGQVRQEAFAKEVMDILNQWKGSKPPQVLTLKGGSP